MTYLVDSKTLILMDQHRLDECVKVFRPKWNPGLKSIFTFLVSIVFVSTFSIRTVNAELPPLYRPQLKDLPRLKGPTNPTPADHALDVSFSPNLNWAPAPDAQYGQRIPTGYDVYFGAVNPPPLVAQNQSACSYTPTNLAYSTVYYWQIVSRDDSAGDNQPGPIWRFTTPTIIRAYGAPPSASNPAPNWEELFARSKLLAQSNLQQSFKLCADGSPIGETYFAVDPVDGEKDRLAPLYTFSFKEDNGSEADYGSFLNHNVTGIDGKIGVLYKHPTRMIEPGLMKRLTLVVTYQDPYTNTAHVFSSTLPVEIYRAPVLMVHGIWDSGSSFDTMKKTLSAIWPQELLCAADYSDTNAYSFSRNAAVMPTAINQLLSQAVTAGFACNRVDVVGHSMGGILALRYIRSLPGENAVSYRNDINRLITLNTPYSGAQTANYLKGGSPGGRIFKKVLNDMGNPTDLGAVDDLRVGSDATLQLQCSSDNDLLVPSLAIRTTLKNLGGLLPESRSEGATEASFRVLGSLAAYADRRFGLGGVLMNEIFNGEAADFIVAQSSQGGGLSRTADVSGQWHVGAQANKSVINEVALALCDDPANPSTFSTTGFNPPVLSYTQPSLDPILGARLGVQKSGLQTIRSTHAVHILSPTPGSTVSAGTTITLTLSGDGQPSSTLALLGRGNTMTAAQGADYSSPIKLFVPPELAGPVTCVAGALGADGLGNWDAFTSETLVVQPAASVTALRLSPLLLTLPEGQSGHVGLMADYNDGISRDISRLPGVVYSSKNSTIATITSSGLVTAIASGSTTVTAALEGFKQEIPVLVIPANAWTFPTPTTNNNVKRWRLYE